MGVWSETQQDRDVGRYCSCRMFQSCPSAPLLVQEVSFVRPLPKESRAKQVITLDSRNINQTPSKIFSILSMYMSYSCICIKVMAFPRPITGLKAPNPRVAKQDLDSLVLNDQNGSLHIYLYCSPNPQKSMSDLFYRKWPRSERRSSGDGDD